MKGTIQYDVNYMRRPGQRVVLRPKNGQRMDRGMMNETAPGSKLKSSPGSIDLTFKLHYFAATTFMLHILVPRVYSLQSFFKLLS